jgi:hypothetical protein
MILFVGLGGKPHRENLEDNAINELKYEVETKV